MAWVSAFLLVSGSGRRSQPSTEYLGEERFGQIAAFLIVIVVTLVSQHDSMGLGQLVLAPAE